MNHHKKHKKVCAECLPKKCKACGYKQKDNSH